MISMVLILGVLAGTISLMRGYDEAFAQEAIQRGPGRSTKC